MTYLILIAGIALLIILIAWARFNAFIAFLIVCIFIGLLSGLSISAIVASIQKGIGDILGSLVVILGLGAMLGKLVADSGAALRISSAFIHAFGKKYIMWALVITCFIVGIPLFYNVGFVLVVPLIITVAARYNIPAVYIGLPALSALSVTHGYLPPHPSPVALVQQFNANIGTTMFYGFMIAIPAILIAGPGFAVTLKKYTNKPLQAFASKDMEEEKLPHLGVSMAAAFMPVVLIALSSLFSYLLPHQNAAVSFFNAIGDPAIAMLISVLFATFTLGTRRGTRIGAVMSSLGEAVKDIALILFVIGGAGALKQILTDSGTSNQIVQGLSSLHVHPLLLAWSISALIRVSVGSATVAGLTTAGIVAPLITTTSVDANLMVLATGAGSLMFSHVNDAGFWLFKEYFNLSIKDTIKTWSMMETIVSLVGLIGVFVINAFL
jgi:Gnt-I system high-affinity gluconate transporter